MRLDLHAVSLGPAVPSGDFAGAVHSVFRDAVNLRGVRQDVLLTVVSSEEADLPQGIRVEASPGNAFNGLAVGDRAVCRGGELMLGNSLRVDLRAGREWKCRLAGLQADMADPDVASAWLCAWRVLAERAQQTESIPSGEAGRGSPSHHQILLSQQVDLAVSGLLNATSSCDSHAVASVEGLIGLGPGLTPAGDDLLVGYLTGLSCATRQRRDRLDVLAAVADHVVRGTAKTNDISRTYLLLAARGMVARALVDLAGAICDGRRDAEICSIAATAMRFGHSSGWYMVQGLLLGIAAWDGAHLLDSVGPLSGNYLPMPHGVGVTC